MVKYREAHDTGEDDSRPKQTKEAGTAQGRAMTGDADRLDRNAGENDQSRASSATRPDHPNPGNLVSRPGQPVDDEARRKAEEDRKRLDADARGEEGKRLDQNEDNRGAPTISDNPGGTRLSVDAGNADAAQRDRQNDDVAGTPKDAQSHG